MGFFAVSYTHLTLPTEEDSVDFGGRRIIKKKKNKIEIMGRYQMKSIEKKTLRNKKEE